MTYLLFTHGSDDGDEQIFTSIKVTANLGAKITLGDLDIIFRGTVVGHEIKETIIDVDLYAAT